VAPPSGKKRICAVVSDSHSLLPVRKRTPRLSGSRCARFSPVTRYTPVAMSRERVASRFCAAAALRALRSAEATSRALAASSACGIARCSSGGAKVSANPMMASTTSSSISVNPARDDMAYQLPICAVSLPALPSSPSE
jgi:hypothetical protein